jgi:hypothetical protein
MSFVKDHAARFYAVLVALVALAAHFVPDLPSELILAVAAALLGLGEGVQRLEDAKTVAAFLYADGKHRK